MLGRKIVGGLVFGFGINLGFLIVSPGFNLISIRYIVAAFVVSLFSILGNSVMQKK
jgi:hypothetical protein